MKKKLHELTREEYETIYRSGFMGEFYPDASGCYEKDVIEQTEKRLFVERKRTWPKTDADRLKVKYVFDFSKGDTSFEISKDEFEEIASELAEERMNVIGQNGNDGEHYRAESWKHSDKVFRTSLEGTLEETFEAVKKFVDANSLDGFNLGTYQRAVKDKVIDIYDILELYKVNNPATAHAIKKLLMPGQRGNKGVIQDLEEAKQSITRAIELEKSYHEEV